MLALMSVLMSHTSLHFFVSSFVLGCAYACVASVNQALSLEKFFLFVFETLRVTLMLCFLAYACVARVNQA